MTVVTSLLWGVVTSASTGRCRRPVPPSPAIARRLLARRLRRPGTECTPGAAPGQDRAGQGGGGADAPARYTNMPPPAPVCRPWRLYRRRRLNRWRGVPDSRQWGWPADGTPRPADHAPRPAAASGRTMATGGRPVTHPPHSALNGRQGYIGYVTPERANPQARADRRPSNW